MKKDSCLNNSSKITHQKKLERPYRHSKSGKEARKKGYVFQPGRETIQDVW